MIQGILDILGMFDVPIQTHPLCPCWRLFHPLCSVPPFGLRIDQVDDFRGVLHLSFRTSNWFVAVIFPVVLG